MPVTNYHTINGGIVAETVAGSRTDYLVDGLGSVTRTVNSGATVVNVYSYYPYGTTITKTGAGVDPKFLWAGASGSRVQSAPYAEQYNRARHYGSGQAAWSTGDPLWPFVARYVYASADSINHTDATGLCELLTGSHMLADYWCLNSGNLQIMNSHKRLVIKRRKNIPHPNPCAECQMKRCYFCGHKHLYSMLEYRAIGYGGSYSGSMAITHNNIGEKSCPKPPSFDWKSALDGVVEFAPDWLGFIYDIIKGIDLGDPGPWNWSSTYPPPPMLKCKGKGWMVQIEAVMDWQCYCNDPDGGGTCVVGPPIDPQNPPAGYPIRSGGGRVVWQ